MFDFIRKLFSTKARVEGNAMFPVEPVPDMPFACVAVRGAEVAAKIRELARPGLVPVLLGDRTSLEMLVEIMSQNEQSPEEIRDEGLQLDVDGWVAQYYREGPEPPVVDDQQIGEIKSIVLFDPAYDFSTSKPLQEIFVGLIPADPPWLVPAYLKPGDWNSCPSPAVHLAFFKRWFERYGAQVVTVSHDVIEFVVERPPTTQEAARQLALEQYAYCPDLVDQGVGTVGNLTAMLQNSRAWYFWWD